MIAKYTRRPMDTKVAAMSSDTAKVPTALNTPTLAPNLSDEWDTQQNDR